jgi:hypothetical protein
MFSKNHHNILKEIDSGSADSRVLADKIGLPAALICHLMEELAQYDFIKVARAYREGVREIAGAYLDTKGKAAVESPDYFLEKPMATDQGNNWYGDRVAGDKFTGDKVMGNKVQIGTVQGDAIAGNKIVNAQDLTQAAQDIKALLDQLATDYPNESPYVHAGRAIDTIKQNPTLTQRLSNALQASGTAAVEKAIAAITDNPAVSVIIAGVKGFIAAE